MTILWALLGFIVAITILVAVHEFGHFWVARLAGIKVLRFSIGFGKPILSFFDKKGTEYALALIPFGGYVKMLDEREAPVAEEERHLAFNQKSVWRRMAVIAAGPVFNILFAIVAYWLMFIIGINSMAPVIGEVAPNSIAAKAQLAPEQELVAINTEKTPSWQSVQIALIPHVGDGGTVDVSTKNIQTKQIQQHQLDLTDWSYDGSQVDFLTTLGIAPYFPKIPTIIGGVSPDSPASKAGLQDKDKIIAVNGEAMTSWQEIVTKVIRHPGKTLQLTVERNGQRLNLSVVIGEKITKNGQKIGFLGVHSPTVKWPSDLIRKQRYNFFQALPIAMKKTWQMTSLTCKMLAKMVVGEVSSKGLSGPIGIAQGAGVSAQLGISYFLHFLALVSIGLAIVNILPIPMLDGGQFLFCIVELITRKPVSERVQEIGLRIGILFIIGVMLLAVYNDISRL